MTEEEVRRREEDKQDKPMEWGGGLSQRRDKERRREEEEKEGQKDVRRGRDDADMDRRLREQLHDDDPLLLMKRSKPKKEKKKHKKHKKDHKRSRRSPSPSIRPSPERKERPVYKGAGWVNRYGIWPGHRWDGVDRSNGWEVKLFTQRTRREAQSRAAHAWSVEDM